MRIRIGQQCENNRINRFDIRARRVQRELLKVQARRRVVENLAKRELGGYWKQLKETVGNEPRYISRETRQRIIVNYFIIVCR